MLSSPSLDLKELSAWIKMQKKKVIVVGLISFILSMLNILISPPLYIISAGYLIQKNAASSLEGEMIQKFSKGKKIEDLGIEPFFYSEKLLKKAIQQSGIQVAVSESILFDQILKNVTLHIQCLKKEVNTNPFQFEVLEFEGITPVHLQLKIKSKNTFEIFSKGVKKQGKVGQQLEFQGMQFIVHKLKENDFKTFDLNFYPLETVYLKVKKRLTIARDKKISSLVQFNFKFKDRTSGKHFINTLINLSSLEFTGHQNQLLEKEASDLIVKKEELNKADSALNLMSRPTEWYYQAKLKKQESLKEEILQIHFLKNHLSQLIKNQSVESILELKIDPIAIYQLRGSIAALGSIDPLQASTSLPHLDIESLKKEITLLLPVIESSQRLEEKILSLIGRLDDLKPYELEEFPRLKALLIGKEELLLCDRKALSNTEQKLMNEKLSDLCLGLRDQFNNTLSATQEEKNFGLIKHKALLSELKGKLLSELNGETKKYFAYLYDEIQRLSSKEQLVNEELAKGELMLTQLESQLKENDSIQERKLESDKKRGKLDEMILLKEIEKNEPFKGGILLNEASSLSFPTTLTTYLLLPIQVVLLITFYLLFNFTKALNLGWLPSFYSLKKLKIKHTFKADFARYPGKKIFITDKVSKRAKTDLTLSGQFSKKLLLIREKDALQLIKSCIIYLHVDDLDAMDLSAFSFIGFDLNALSLDQIKMVQASYEHYVAIV